MVEVEFDGRSLKPEGLLELSRGGHTIRLAPAAVERVRRARNFLVQEAASKIVYGVNTGFGSFADVHVGADDLARLQVNLIRSHAVGVGAPLPLHRVRMLLALRINVLCAGHSGIRLETLERLVCAFNASCLPKIPEKGSVGASGDLCPLAHLALGLMGEGEMWDMRAGVWRCAADVLKECNCLPIELEAKEGLALINGTQFITALACEALVLGERALVAANVVAALTFAALEGNDCFLDSRIHTARLHPGQRVVAGVLRGLLESEDDESKPKKRVQDAYTLRCIPQVHGVVLDTLKFVRSVLEREMNAATDNPMIFVADESRPDAVVSGGNFHGEYPAKMADFMAIAVNELGNMSERRTYRLLDSSLSGLASFLIPKEKSGLNSGLMIVQYTSAALCSENKVLVHPASSDTIPTSEGQEDHVSMGAYASRKCLTVLENVQTIIGIELLCACQAVDVRDEPIVLPAAIRGVYDHVRKTRGIAAALEDRFFSPDIQVCADIIRNGELLELVKDIKPATL